MRGPRFPRQFGSYLLLMELGHGGMGQVFLAKKGQMLGIDRYCVIKTLHAEHSDKSEYLGRFLDEARLAVNLNHRNICAVTDVGMSGDTLYMAMDLIVGRDLKTVQERLVERDRRIPEAVALFLVREMLEALDYAHRLTHPVTGEPFQLVHRDVSPANVMLSFEGEVKLIDFGLASSKMKTEHTKGDYVMGKLAYMSPEQAANLAIDARTDMYAAAIVAYELLAGERFYEGLIPEAIWRRAGTGEHEPARMESFDPPLKNILRTALNVNPARRYPTCAGFRNAIDDYRMERSLVARSEEVRAFMQSLFPEGMRAHRDQLARLSEMEAALREHSPPPQKKPISVEGDPSTSQKSSPSQPSPAVVDSNASVTSLEEAEPLRGPDLSEVTPEKGSVVPLNPATARSDAIGVTSPGFAAVDASAGHGVSHPHEETDPLRGRRSPPWVPIAAALSLVLAAFAAGLALRDNTPPVAVTTQPPSTTSSPSTAPPPPANTATAAAPTTDEPNVAAEPPPAASVTGQREPPAVKPTVAKATSKPPKRRPRRAEPKPSPPASKPVAAVAKADPPPAAKPPPRASRTKRPVPATFSGKLKLVLSCKKPCAKDVRKIQQQGADAPQAAFRKLPQLVEQCVEECR
jgi:serine/threonine protein kinase